MAEEGSQADMEKQNLAADTQPSMSAPDAQQASSGTNAQALSDTKNAQPQSAAQASDASTVTKAAHRATDTVYKTAIETGAQSSDGEEEVLNKIFTIPNLISFMRLCMIPAFFVLLLDGHDFLATFLFAVAASTDWVDGQIARRTHTVSKLGKLLDPTVDRLLMIMGVIGLYVVNRIPLWIIVLVLARDILLLIGGAYILIRYKVRVAVVYPGKVATTFLFFGFFGLLLNWPLVPGLALCDLSWLPGFTAVSVSWGIWFVYAGLVVGLCTTVYYIITAVKKCRIVQKQRAAGIE